MKTSILLNYNENFKKIEDEEKLVFLFDLLNKIGVPIDGIELPENLSLSVENKIKLRSLLTTYGIQVIDNRDGSMQIFIDNQLVADWHKPIYKLKKDLSQLDRKKQLYVEMTIEYNSLFESSIDNNEG